MEDGRLNGTPSARGKSGRKVAIPKDPAETVGINKTSPLSLAATAVGEKKKILT